MTLIAVVAIVIVAAVALWVAANPPDRCELLRAREVGLPEPCGERATGWYTSELGEVYRACDEHANAEVKP